MKKLSAFNASRPALLSALALVFLLILLCTHFTDLVADDYRYCFSYADDSRIEHIAQIFPSMAAHRQTMNGRVIAHFLVQLFLLLPKLVFDFVNALFFTALVWLICHLTGVGRGTNALLCLAVFGCLWCLQPDFGQVFLWLTGSINYLWCGVFCLVWLLFPAGHFLTGRSPSPAGQAVFVLYSFLVGAYSENATVALVAMLLAFLVLIRFVQRRKLAPWLWLSLASMLAGFFFMMLAPAESVNKSAEMRFDVLISNFVENFRYFLRFWPLLLSFVLFYFLACKKHIDLSTRLLSLVYLFGALAGHFVLVFAMYTAGRSTYIGLVLLLCANAALFVPLFEGEHRRLLAVLCVLCLLVAAYKTFIGVRDIRDTHALLRYNEELITASAAAGEHEVQLPRPYAKTSYSALEGLAYLNTDDPDDWPNAYMAKFYGVDRVIGY